MSIFLDKMRKKWRFDFETGGKRYSGYCIDPETGTAATSRTSAEKIVTKIRARFLSARAAKVSIRSYTLAEALAAYASQVKGGKNWRNRSRQIAEFLSFFGADCPVCTLTDDRVWDYIAWARGQQVSVWTGGAVSPCDLPKNRQTHKTISRKRSDATINRALDVLRKALRIAGKHADPVTGLSVLPVPPTIPVLKEAKRLPTPVPIEDVARILAELQPQAADAVALGALTGMRKGEMLRLKVTDFREAEGGIRIRGDETKGRRDEWIPLGAEALAVVKRRAGEARGLNSIWLFPSPISPAEPLKDYRTAWLAACRRAGVQHHRIHDLKATFVTTALKATNDPRLVQNLARHKSYSTTERYLAAVGNERRAAADLINGSFSGISGIRKNTPETPGSNVLRLPHTSPTRQKPKKKGGVISA